MTVAVDRPNSATRAKRKNNHYSLQDFFQPDLETGVIEDWNGSRNIFTSEDFIIGLQEGLEDEVGEASAAVMYSAIHPSRS